MSTVKGPLILANTENIPDLRIYRPDSLPHRSSALCTVHLPAVNEGMEKKMVTTILRYVGTTIRMHSFTSG